MISGTMPKWQQIFLTIAFGVMCILLGGFGLLSGIIPHLRAGAVRPGRGLLLSSLVFVAVAGFGIGTQVWFRRRIVSEFSYGGSALRFRTLGTAEMQIRDLSEIAEVADWRGRGGALGYRFRFRDGHKVYLQYGVSNSGAAAELIRQDLRLSGSANSSGPRLPRPSAR